MPRGTSKEPKVELKSKQKNTPPKKEKKEIKKRSPGPKAELSKPSLRSIYSNSKNTFIPLGFGSDYKTKKCVVIFSDLLTGQVHTTALALWNKLKLKEVKELNPQT